jgi:antitoxin component YwqK of YwqJK toxin-antitoxin module
MKTNNKIVVYGVCIMLSLVALGCSEQSKSKMTEKNNSDISTKEIENIPSNISYKTEFKGEQKVVTPFVNDKRQGVAKWYWENGAIRSTMPYENNELNGLVEDYFITGELRSSTQYVNGKKHGVEKSYNNGKVEREITFQNDEENGIEKIYSSQSGKIWQETPFVNGKEHGIQKEYDENAKVIRETKFVTGNEQ